MAKWFEIDTPVSMYEYRVWIIDVILADKNFTMRYACIFEWALSSASESLHSREFGVKSSCLWKG